MPDDICNKFLIFTSSYPVPTKSSKYLETLSSMLSIRPSLTAIPNKADK